MIAGWQLYVLIGSGSEADVIEAVDHADHPLAFATTAPEPAVAQAADFRQAWWMPRTVIVVTGLPGVGKTTLATQLAEAFDWPVITRDTIKEAAADALPDWEAELPDLPELLGGVSYEVMYALARRLPGTVILESNFRERSIDALRGLATEGTVQVLCHCPIEVALERYNGRPRHAIHRHPRVDTETLLTLGPVEPLPLDGPCITVDTSREVDLAALQNEISSLLQSSST